MTSDDFKPTQRKPMPPKKSEKINRPPKADLRADNERLRKALHDAADWLDQAGLPVEATMARNAAAYKG